MSRCRKNEEDKYKPIERRKSYPLKNRVKNQPKHITEQATLARTQCVESASIPCPLFICGAPCAGYSIQPRPSHVDNSHGLDSRAHFRCRHRVVHLRNGCEGGRCYLFFLSRLPSSSLSRVSSSFAPFFPLRPTAHRRKS